MLSHCQAQLSIFEDYEAVIKMIIKGRRPTMRYVSRPTESRSCSFDRINLDHPKSKSYLFTPRTNLRTCWPKVVSRGMNGTIFFDCSTSWISRCFLQPSSLEHKAKCHVEESSRKDRRRTTCGRKKWGQHVWYQETSWAQSKPLP